MACRRAWVGVGKLGEMGSAVDKKKDVFRTWKKSGNRFDYQVYLETKRVARRFVWKAKERKCEELAEELDTERG